MHLHKTTQSHLVAELTQDDLYSYCVTFEEMRIENEQTVRLLRDILQRAKSTLGWSLPRAQLLRVDVLPGAGGGCIILFSADTHEKRLRVKAENRTLLFKSEKTDDFLDLLLRLKAGPFPKSTCAYYREGSSFFGIFRFQSVLDTRRAATVLSEYGTLCRVTPEAAAFLQEHAKPLNVRQAP